MLYDKTILPARGLVLVAPIPEATQTPKGLLLPKKHQKVAGPEDVERHGSIVAEVIRIGLPPFNDAGAEVPLDGLEVGQTVIVRTQYGSTLHLLDREPFFLVPFGAIGGLVVDVEPETASEPNTPQLIQP